MSVSAGHASQPSGPLNGLRVLDLSQFLPGPFAVQMLADLGATVLKVEPPGGDPARQLGGDVFHAVNRNKVAAEFDLKDLAQRDVCLRLAVTADVVVEGFRPGVAARLGIGPDDVRGVEPAAIYCSISGFPAHGARAKRPGHDLTYLAASGALTVAGHWDGAARRSGVPLSDLAAASYAAVAILGALHERTRTGVGCHLEVDLASAAQGFASSRAGRGRRDAADARDHLHPANDVFTTADCRTVAIGVIEDRTWQALVAALGDRDPRLADPRLRDVAGRQRAGDEVHALLVQLCAAITLDDLLALGVRHDLAIEEVVTTATALGRAEADGYVVPHADDRYLLFPARRDGRPVATLRRPPDDLPLSGADVPRDWATVEALLAG